MNFFGQQPTVSLAEKELGPLLLDEGCQVLSTFELNKVASLTYGDMVCDELFELIEKIVALPLDYSPLTIQKTLVVLKHILIYGSAKCVNSGYGIGKFVERLITFNTVLAAQQQKGASAFFQRLQGGGVDRGGPVRDSAAAVHELLRNINELQRIRNERASQHSLVPIGDDKVAFITDDVRHLILKKKIEEQARVEIKSNLAKSEGGFGGGYMTNDGKNVVGAAHGIDAMLKMAQLEKRKFSDDGLSGPSPEDKILLELMAEAKRERDEMERAAAAAAAAHNENLLDSFNPQPSGEIDLLDFGVAPVSTPAAAPAATTVDLFGGGCGDSATATSAGSDLLGLAARMQPFQGGGGLLDFNPTPAPLFGGGMMDNGLLSLGSGVSSASQASVDPFASVPTTMTTRQPMSQSSLLDATASTPDTSYGGISGMMGNLSIAAQPPPHPAMAAPVEDRFAALDALASAGSGSGSGAQAQATVLDAKLAENRLLAGAGSTGFSMSISRASAPSLPASMPPAPPPSQPSTDLSSLTMSSISMGMPSAVPSNAAMGLPPSEAMVTPGSGQVAAAYGGGSNNNNNNNDDDNPWVMGGTTGSGLEPLGAAPAAPPPPLPWEV